VVISLKEAIDVLPIFFKKTLFLSKYTSRDCFKENSMFLAG